VSAKPQRHRAVATTQRKPASHGVVAKQDWIKLMAVWYLVTGLNVCEHGNAC